MSTESDKIITQNDNIMKYCFKCWLVSHVPKLKEQPKWFSSDQDLKAGDVILFLHKIREVLKLVEIRRSEVLFWSIKTIVKISKGKLEEQYRKS